MAQPGVVGLRRHDRPNQSAVFTGVQIERRSAPAVPVSANAHPDHWQGEQQNDPISWRASTLRLNNCAAVMRICRLSDAAFA
jgi:hypothetical protein